MAVLSPFSGRVRDRIGSRLLATGATLALVGALVSLTRGAHTAGAAGGAPAH